MGNCLISIHVTGCHHNGLAHDIDQMAAKFADDLAKHHTVSAATLVSGGENNLTVKENRFPLKSEKPEFYALTGGNKADPRNAETRQ